MRPAVKVPLEAGRVYRTREFSAWSKNPSRLAKRLVRDGALVRVRAGLYAHRQKGRFGEVPPSDTALMRSFLGETPFVFSGPNTWNTLGLGTTAVSPVVTVYNQMRSGQVELDGRRFDLHRVAFPQGEPPKEWYVVDLLQHPAQAGTSRAELAPALKRATERGAFDPNVLRRMANVYGTSETRSFLQTTLGPPPAV